MYDTKGVACPNKTKNICTDTNDSIRPVHAYSKKAGEGRKETDRKFRVSEYLPFKRDHGGGGGYNIDRYLEKMDDRIRQNIYDK